MPANVNKVIINVKSIKESKHCTIPETPSDCCLIQMHLGGFLIEPLSPEKCRLSFMVNIDPQMGLPSLLNWFAGKLIHLLLSRMRTASKFGPDSEYAKRIKNNPKTYEFINQRIANLWKNVEIS